jgi:spore maturation protein SpmB
MKTWRGVQRLWNGAFLCAILFMPAASGWSQGMIARWFNKSGSTVSATALGAAIDMNTNVYVLGRIFGATNRNGQIVVANAVSGNAQFFRL